MSSAEKEMKKQFGLMGEQDMCRRRSTFVILIVFGIELVMTPAKLHAQSKAAPSFTAASIKRNTSVNSNSSTSFLPGRFVARYQTLSRLIITAYRIKDYQLSGGPSWTYSERYDVDATTDNNPSRDEMRLMIQNLLAERFQLRIEREKKDISVFALSLGKNGITFGEARPRQTTGFDVEPGKLGAYGVTMSELADELSRRLDRPVIDKTGMSGSFDFTLQYAPVEAPANRAGDASGPDIVTAIEEQLGLRLEPTKASFEVIVIGSVQKPTEN